MDLPLSAMTPRMRRVLVEAARQASHAGHRGTEHVLLALALAMDGDGIAGQVLTHLGVREAVQARLVQVLPHPRVRRRGEPGSASLRVAADVAPSRPTMTTRTRCEPSLR